MIIMICFIVKDYVAANYCPTLGEDQGWCEENLSRYYVGMLFIYFKLRISTKVMAKNFSLGMKEVILDSLFITLFFVNLCSQWSQNNELSDELLSTFMLTGSS